MLDGIGQSLIQKPHDLDDVPRPQFGINRQALWRHRSPVQRDIMRTQLRGGALAPRSERQHQVAADVVHRIDDKAKILQRRSGRFADRRARLAAFAERDDADELAAQSVMKVAHQPRALQRQRRGAGALLLAGEARLQFVLGLAHLSDQAAGKAVDLIERAGKSPGQPGADRDQQRRIGQARDEDPPVGRDLEHREHVANPAGQHDRDGAAQHETGDVVSLQHRPRDDQRQQHQIETNYRHANE